MSIKVQFHDFARELVIRMDLDALSQKDKIDLMLKLMEHTGLSDIINDPANSEVQIQIDNWLAENYWKKADVG